MTLNNTIFILLLLLPYILYGQDVPFPTSQAKWCYNQYGDTGEDLGDFCYEFKEDSTIINGQIYFPFLNGSDTLGFIRTEEEQVFNLPERSAEEEYLLYDFSLMEGDTFRTQWGYWTGNNEIIELQVTTIDSTQMVSGEYRKTWYLQNQDSGYETHWTEGIGDAVWLMHAPAYLFSVSGGFQLICHVVSNELQYDPGGNMYCSTVSAENVKAPFSIHILPNPFMNKVWIKSPDTHIQEIRIFDQNGRQVWSNIYDQPIQTIPIDLEPYTGQFFVLMIRNSEGLIHCEKGMRIPQ